MADINILDSSVYNLISAGEVVERPSSVVKELVENAIDSGANRIVVSVKEGGTREISVTDNGCGMSESNLKKALLPHATSKLASAADLDAIATLGFRGEALASIAAVSRVKIVTRRHEDGEGYSIVAEGGKIGDAEPCGAAAGTTVTVSDLFFNTPVRARFLKKPAQEERAVTETVSALILANPDLSFTYVTDGKTVFSTSGGFDNAVYTVYSNEVANALIWFDEKRDDGYRVYGYTGRRELTRHNKSLQTVIVNGRTVSDKTVETAATQAYGGSLMKRCYPVFVINLILPFDEVDVNVHPSKNEVRFRRPNAVFSAVYRAIEKALAKQANTIRIGEDPLGGQTTLAQDAEPASAASSSGSVDPSKIIPAATGRRPEDLLRGTDERQTGEKEIKKALEKQREKVEQTAIFTHSIYKPQTKVSSPGAFTMESVNREEKASELFEDIDRTLRLGYRIVGQVFGTFLIVEQGDKAYLIDQHAVHERLLYDKFKERIDSRQTFSQPLLMPYVLDCDGPQYETVKKFEDKLTELGFEISEFGGYSFRIGAVPDVLTDINLDAFFGKLFEERGKLASFKNSDMIDDAIATWACKSAVKGGDRLTDAQIESLLGQMSDGVPLQCPHGRPTTFVFTRKDLDKLFKRIV